MLSKYYFFNHIGKERASQFQKPPQEESAAWEKAWSERPNDRFVFLSNNSLPSYLFMFNSCVPVRACGFKDLDLRVKVQENQVQIFRAELHAIQEKLNTIQTRHDLTTSVRLEDCRRRHMALARRALSLASKVQV
jgi:nuclear pore complex protein Nup54